MAELVNVVNKYFTDETGESFGTGETAHNIALLSFKLATQDNLTQWGMVDGIIDEYEDATGVDASGSSNEVRDATGKYYYGGTLGDATGGTVTTYSSGGNDYKVHSFLSGATNFVVPGTGSVDLLIVAGGGAGADKAGGYSSGGGGAGGVRQLASTSLTAGTWVATVGAGGSNGNPASDGSNSTFALGGTTYSATGGGRGGRSSVGESGGNGGSGGGASNGSGGTGNAGGYSPAEGYNGGAGSTGGYAAGGGGGAGGAGADNGGSGGSGTGGNGGVGVQNAYRTGSNVYYGGGGGGGSSNSQGSGGNGGGGSGANPGNPGTANTGGGGGGTSWTAPANTGGGSGGSGIIVARYIENSFVTYDNLTLISNATTASSAPTTARITIFEEDTDATTINTDIKAFVSRDNGTTYTEFTLTDEGDYASGKQVLAGSVDISGQPSGTSIRYKIRTYNSKKCKFHGVGLTWGN